MIEFDAKYDLLADNAFIYTQISTDGGTSWINLKVEYTNANLSFTGTNPNWTYYKANLSSYYGQSNVKLRFRLQANDQVRKDGFYVKNIVVRNDEAVEFRSDYRATKVVVDNGTLGTLDLSKLNDYTINAGGKIGNIIIANGLTLKEDKIIDGDLSVSAGILDLNGHTLKVTGNLTTSGTSKLKMTNANDVLEVGGDLTVGGSASGQCSAYYYNCIDTDKQLTNGTIKLNGNFFQKGNSNGTYSSQNTLGNNHYSFYADSNNTVILNGTGKQSVSFQSTYSRFANLVLENNSSDGVVFETSFVYTTLEQKSTKVTINTTVADGGMTLSEDLTVSTGFASSVNIDLNGHQLTVNGDLNVTGGILNLNGGTLHVKGNLGIEIK